MGGRGVASFSNNGPHRFSSGLGTRIDETLKQALGVKGEPESIASAMRNANPHYSREYSEYSENCQRAVVAYELRRRGYKVSAQPTYKGDKVGEIAYVDRKNGIYKSRWTRAFSNAKTEYVGAGTGQKMIAKVDGKMAEYGNGSRAVLQVMWRNGGAHVFNLERQNGKTLYIDAQRNKRYTAAEIQKRAKPGSVNIVRTDNLRISDRAKDSVTSRKY